MDSSKLVEENARLHARVRALEYEVSSLEALFIGEWYKKLDFFQLKFLLHFKTV